MRLGEVGIGALIGALIVAGVQTYAFRSQLETTRKTEAVRLARELTREFYSADATFSSVRVAIDRCEKLYKRWGGKFDYDQVNRYLGFFEDLGFYSRIGALDFEIVDQMFGAVIVEAYEYNEVRKYIDELRRNSKQPRAFEDFERLAKKLAEIPERKELVELARRGCYK